MSEIHSRFPWIDFHRFRYQSIKIISLLTIFIDLDFYLLATQGFNNKPEDDFIPGFEEKIRFFRFFKNICLKSDDRLILRLSTATQLSTNLLFA